MPDFLIYSESVNLQTVNGSMLALGDNGAIDGSINHRGSFSGIPTNSVRVTTLVTQTS